MELSRIFIEYENEFWNKHGKWLLPSQKHALNSILKCRTPDCGEVYVKCPNCDRIEMHLHSCGNRNCPKCQNHEATVWLDRQRQKLLPVKYFLVTFTVSRELRNMILYHQTIAFEAMFQASRQALVEMGENSRFLGGEIGMTGVLHTHNRRLDFHPHIHYLVPALCITRRPSGLKTKRWKFLFPEVALAKLFRGKLLAALKKAGLEVPEKTTYKWVVNCKKVGYGAKALEYLSRYLYRGVISEKRIISSHGGMVSFLYLESRSGKWKTRTLPGEDFLMLVLRHVLPKGFRRVRDYGFLHGNAGKKLRRIQLHLHVKLPIIERPKRPAFRCLFCDAEMQVISRKKPANRPSVETFSFAASP